MSKRQRGEYGIYLSNGKAGEAGVEAIGIFKENNWHFIEIDILIS